METLSGYFIPRVSALSNGLVNLFNNERIHQFKILNEESVIILILGKSAAISYSCIVFTEIFQLTGQYWQLKGIADSIFLVSQVVPSNHTHSAENAKIIGTIESIGSIFEIHSVGMALLVEISHMSNIIKLVLCGDALNARGFLIVGDDMHVFKKKKFCWVSVQNEINLTNCEKSYSYLVSSMKDLAVHPKSVSARPNQALDLLAQEYSLDLRNPIPPDSIVIRDILANIEVDIEVDISYVNSKGWIQVRYHELLHLFLFAPHFPWLIDYCRHLIGAKIIAFNVVPVVLWNKLRGFAFVARSSVSLVRIPVPGINGNDLQSLFDGNSSTPKVPLELKRRCHVYTAFRADLSRRLSECIQNIGDNKIPVNCLVWILEMMADDPELLNVRVTQASKFIVNAADLPKDDWATALRRHTSLTIDKYSIQDEFMSAWDASFLAVRGSCDIDLLCSQMPFAVSANSILKNIEIITSKRKRGLSEVRKYATHFIELFEPPPLYAELSRPNVIVVGSLISWEAFKSDEGDDPFCSLCVIGDSVGSKLQLIVTDCTPASIQSLAQLLISLGWTENSRRLSFQLGHMSSAPVVAVHRPMCLSEEIPSNLRYGFNVKLIVSIYSLKIIAPRQDDAAVFLAETAETLPVSSARKRKSDFALLKGVREILQQPIDKKFKSFHNFGVRGLVVYKNKNMSFSTKKSEKCSLTLRDNDYDDYLTLYLPACAAMHVMVGMVIEVRHCRMSTSKGGKSVYLDFVSDIRIVKMSTIAVVKELCQRNLESVYAATALSRNCDRQPPKIYLERLYLTSSEAPELEDVCFNRVLWTLTGHILLISEVNVRLRCKSCFTQFANRRFHCSKCSSVSNTDNISVCAQVATSKQLSASESARMSVVWEMIVGFDDGSGECSVHFDGDLEVLTFLSSANYSSAKVTITKIMNCIKERVYEHGAFSFQSLSEQDFESKYNCPQISSFSTALEAMAIKDPTESLNSSHIKYYLDRGEASAALAIHLRYISRSCVWQFSGRESGYAPRDSLKLQAANAAFPYQTLFHKSPVVGARRLLLTGHNLRLLQGDSLRLEAWRILHEIETSGR